RTPHLPNLVLAMSRIVARAATTQEAQLSSPPETEQRPSNEPSRCAPLAESRHRHTPPDAHSLTLAGATRETVGARSRHNDVVAFRCGRATSSRSPIGARAALTM